MSNHIVLDENRCTACGACKNICPVSAIEMYENSEGFFYPIVNNQMCIECGKCKNVCLIGKRISKKKCKQTAYAGIHFNEKIYNESSSGGAFTAIASKIISDKGYVWGASFDENFNVYHSCTNTLEGLEKFRGSKYIQSKIGDSYIRIKEQLEDGKTVLFSGTPCQVEGLNLYLDCDYSNLVTIDLVCHGVPNNKFFKDYLLWLKGVFHADNILEYSFRGTQGYKEKVKYLKKEKVFCKVTPWNMAPYFYSFMYNDIMRKSCYDCAFCNLNRPGDITLCDFWGARKYYNINDKNGISGIISNTNKGDITLKSIKNRDINVFPIKIDELKNNNFNLKSSICMTKKRKIIFEDWNKNGFNFIVKKYMRLPFFKRIYSRIAQKYGDKIKLIFGEGL